MRSLAGILAFLAVVAIGAPARAQATGDSFESLAQGATRVDRNALAGIVWSLTAKCDSGDDLAKRQCRAVRDRLAQDVQGKTLIVDGDATAFSVGAFDEKKNSAPISVQGCIACAQPIAVDGTSMYIVSDDAPVTFNGDVATAATVHSSRRSFRSAGELADYEKTVVPRLRTEFVVKIASSPSWQSGKKQGIAVSIVGFRVYDPCDGGIVCSSPKSGTAGVDKKVCGTVDQGAADQAAAPKVDDTPDELTADMIMAAMKPVRDAAEKCFDTYGVAGEGKVKVTVNADGTVAGVEEIGDFDGTPTGACIDKAVKVVTFPKTKKGKQSFRYPILLR